MSLSHRTGTIHHYRGIPVHAPLVVHEETLNWLCEDVGPGGVVLDVGCGHGGMSQRLVDAGYQVIAIDTDVSQFQARDAVVYTGELDELAEQLSSRYDIACVIALEVIEHTRDPVGFLASLQRLETHKAILSFPNLHEIHNHILFFRKGYFSWWNPGAYTTVGHRSIMVDWLLEKHCEELAIRITRQAYVDRFAPRTAKAWLAYLLARLAASRDVPFDKRVNGSVLARLEF